MAEPTNANGSLIDQHLMMVGKLVNNAALCDAILFSAFIIISNCEQKIAHAIYFSSESLPAKKNIITRIMKVLDDNGDLILINRIIAATEKAQKQRNELSHALLQVNGDQFLRVNARHQGQQGKPITGPYLDSLLLQSSQAQVEALIAFQELCQKHGKSPLINLE